MITENYYFFLNEIFEKTETNRNSKFTHARTSLFLFLYIYNIYIYFILLFLYI